MYRIKCPQPNVKESEKLILDPYPDPNQHQNLITSTGSSLTHAWSTSVNAFVSYLLTEWYNDWITDRQTDGQTDRHTV